MCIARARGCYKLNRFFFFDRFSFKADRGSCSAPFQPVDFLLFLGLDSMVRDGDTDSSGFSTREAFSPLTVVGVVLANSEAKQSEDLGEIVRITRTSGGTHSVVYDW